MNSKQFQSIAEKKNVLGQFVSVISVSEQEKNVLPEYKGKGIVKVSAFQAHIRKDEYLEVLNTSTGAVETGVQFTAKRESYYYDIAHCGFCRALKSDPSKLYVELRFNDKDKEADDSFLVDEEGNFYDFSILKEKSKNTRAKLVEVFKVSIRQFKIESIARLKIGGEIFDDENLIKYIDMIEARKNEKK